MIRTRVTSLRTAASILLVLASPAIHAQVAGVPRGKSPQDLVAAMLVNEDNAGKEHARYTYLSKEKSDRTGGHLWTERVVEVTSGKVRMLLAEDGQPLSPDRLAAERVRLAGIVADPAGFAKREQALKNDEIHAKQMLALLGKAYLFSDVREQGGMLLIDYRPNPDYSPQSMEERVLHGMSGTVQIDPRAMRMHHIDGKLPADISIGFGILATIRAGSSFGTTRGEVAGQEWKTLQIDTDINGKAIFFKAIAKNEHAERTDFARVPNDLTVAQAVEMAER